MSVVNAQFGTCDCTSTITGGQTINFSAINWTGTGCPTSGSTSYTGNLCISMSNGSTVVMNDANFDLYGDFKIVNSGTGANVSIPASNTFHVAGDMGYTTNNNIAYTIDGTLSVDGTLYSKNNSSLAGTGTLNAGGVNFSNGATAGTGLTYHVGTCSPSPSTFCSTVLPIKLESFYSKVKGEAIELNWSTSSEINFNYFSLQKGTDGKDFSEIGRVNGHGTTNVGQNYKYEDSFPLIGKNYYRLTAVDVDNYQETFMVSVLE